MVNCHISPDLKDCALQLWYDGWDTEDVCMMIGVSHASLYCWEAIFEEFGSVTHPPSPIRGQSLHILTRALSMACEDLFSEESDLYLDEVIAWLALIQDIFISKSTLCQNLKELGLTRKILHKVATERNEALHEEFRESLWTNFQGDRSEFVCVDEVSKNELTWARHYGRAMAGQRAPLTDVFIHGD
ncbi:hypothetical protein PAXRUDRAFT_11628 [Paxillus rubicundulus Ve08.2h10]|uniref:Unplaced genomic scaffold scaffold_239, whole genome shotgun sequence n=1 Tax=Paxillus rubicundulus Ve08.2h10 TaxID=930991 RepID=A0A0D0DQZ2_9AGAM|nr:hypothetical protein PAXRUDRAFT_11628 [Paxillus rubicundulus Ve08.2h10]